MMKNNKNFSIKIKKRKKKKRRICMTWKKLRNRKLVQQNMKEINLFGASRTSKKKISLEKEIKKMR
jgi:hypothetical protein